MDYSNIKIWFNDQDSFTSARKLLNKLGINYHNGLAGPNNLYKFPVQIVTTKHSVSKRTCFMVYSYYDKNCFIEHKATEVTLEQLNFEVNSLNLNINLWNIVI